MAEQHSIEYRGLDFLGFPGYRVGSDGSVWLRWVTCRWGRRLTDKWRLMKQCVQPKRTAGRAYRYLNLVPPEGGKFTTFRVHRLILEAFVGPCPDGMEARHKDGNPGNNRLDNLAWGTKEENTEDNRKSGAYKKTARARLFTHEGKTLCLKEWADHFGIPYTCLAQRLNNLGMSFAEAVSRPYRGTSSNGAHWKKIKDSAGSRAESKDRRG